MDREDRIRLTHMLEAAREAVEFMRGETLESLKGNRKLGLALTKEIEIIGEAASKVSNEIQNQSPEVPWAAIVGMRNRLIHAYFDIDFEQVWIAVSDDLPELIAELEAILTSLSKDEP